MNAFTSSLRRAAFARPTPALRAFPNLAPRLRSTPAAPHVRSNILGMLAARGVASSTSGRPASQTPQQAAQNIKDEVGGSASDLARSIAGGNMTSDAITSDNKTFLGITSAVAQAVPQPYIVFGLAGALPYLLASGSTIYLAREAGRAIQGLDSTIDPNVAISVLNHALDVQTTYGAVLLSFLGALHWGFEFAGYGGYKGYSRLALGAAPVLFAWPTLALAPTSALIAQWIGFTSLWYADLKATSAGWTPKWYSQYRFYLSILVGTCIIGSLAGTSYFGPVAGHGKTAHTLNTIRAERKEKEIERAGLVPGDIEAVTAPEDADAYVIVRKKEKADEGSDDESDNESKTEDASKKSESKGAEEPKEEVHEKEQNDPKEGSKTDEEKSDSKPKDEKKSE